MVWVSSGTRLGFGRQSSMASKATVSRFLGITNQGFEFPDKRVEAKKYPSFGVGRRPFGIFPGKITRPASFTIVPTTAEIFYYIFGIDSFTAGAPNTHVMYPVDAAELPFQTVGAYQGGSPAFLREFVGLAYDRVRATLSEGAELQLGCDVQAYDVESEEVVSPSPFTQPAGTGQRPYMFYDRNANVTVGGTYDYSLNTISGGRTWSRVRGFEWSLGNNLKVHHFSQAANSQKPGLITTGFPDFALTVELTPSGKLAADVDAVYDLLENETRGDLLIPFYRSATDRLDFVFSDCLFTEVPHSWREDGNEISVRAVAEPEEIRVVARDSIAAYNTL